MYYNFRSEITAKDDIHRIIEDHPKLKSIIEGMQAKLSQWWEIAQHDFASLAHSNTNGNGNKKMEAVFTITDDYIALSGRTFLNSQKAFASNSERFISSSRCPQ